MGLSQVIRVLLATATLLVGSAVGSFADDIYARLAIDVTEASTVNATLVLRRTNVAPVTELFYVVVPLKGFTLREQSEVLVLHKIDTSGQTLLNIAIPSQLVGPIELPGTVVIPRLDQGDLNTLRVKARAGTSFIYRTALGIDEQMSVKLDAHEDSRECRLIPKGLLIEISEVTLKFSRETEFVLDPRLSDSQFPADLIKGSDFTAKRTAPLAGYYSVVYRLPVSSSAGRFVLSLLLALLGLLPTTLEIVGTAQPRTKRILYLFELLAYVAAMVYFAFWNRGYLLDNISDFVAPSIATLVVIAFLMASIVKRGPATASRANP